MVESSVGAYLVKISAFDEIVIFDKKRRRGRGGAAAEAAAA